MDQWSISARSGGDWERHTHIWINPSNQQTRGHTQVRAQVEAIADDSLTTTALRLHTGPSNS